MSAFFVGRETINAVGALAITGKGPMPVSKADALGKSLWMNNALAIEARYGEPAETCLPTIDGYQFAYPKQNDLPTILKATNCYLYQCEEGDVHLTALHREIRTIADRFAHITTTAEYDAAPWGLCG